VTRERLTGVPRERAARHARTAHLQHTAHTPNTQHTAHIQHSPYTPCIRQVPYARIGRRPIPTRGPTGERRTRMTSFTLPAGAAGARIVAFGHYQPSRVVTNAELAQHIDTNDEWIRSRVGIAERRIAAPEETVTDMSVQAGGKALAAGGLSPDDVDLVIVATCTPESPIPNVSASVAHRLGIAAPGAFDVNAACAGFCYALATASDAIRSGSARNVLVIGAEKLSQWVDWTDRATCIIFADGAGAAVVTGADTPGIGPVVWGSSGGHADKIFIKDRNSHLFQEGQSVFRWATTTLHPVAIEACRRAGVDPAELAAFVPHQANLRIVEAIARRVRAPNAVIADDIVTAGNTSAASIPLAISRMAERNQLPSGAPALILGFGAGLTYAAQVIKIP
jgi:3-oxoacyl-[acyl-carrier-protein] synthase III